MQPALLPSDEENESSCDSDIHKPVKVRKKGAGYENGGLQTSRSLSLRVLICDNWKMIYVIRDPEGNAIYVGQTKNLKQRIGSHATNSSSKNLQEVIKRIREKNLGWSLFKNCKPVEGLEFGVPGDTADLYEAYFINNIDGKGTIMNPDYPYRSNASVGNGVHIHMHKFKSVEQALIDAAKEGRSLFYPTPKGVVDDQRLQSKRVVDIIESVADRTGESHESSEEYILAKSQFEACTNAMTVVSDITKKLKYYKDYEGVIVNRQEFIKDWNNIANTAHKDYVPDNDNWLQATQSNMIKTLYKSCIKYLENGDPNITTPDRDLTKWEAVFMLERLYETICARNNAGGTPPRSFSSMMAWSKPGTKFHEPLPDKLARLNKVKHFPLNDYQLNIVDNEIKNVRTLMKDHSRVKRE
tara:strand:- start:2671 stop:3906 length:1236 start_codon:yes stop_codon:yes gene_type:complete